jgi:hypothetical protein
MSAGTLVRRVMNVAPLNGRTIRSDAGLLRTFVIAAGACWAFMFVVIGLRYDLQMYADGSIFSYSVATQDAWVFHWHNISGRLFVYLFCLLPAETFVQLSGSARGGIAVYGFIFFAMQLLGLIATYAADRSKGRVIFSFACCSIACLCPLVFGFPTEAWAAHSLFWPTLAICHFARDGVMGVVAVFAMLLALVFTHEGALIFEIAILATLLLRGVRDPAFLRAACVFIVVLSIWSIVKLAIRPDEYTAPVMANAALKVFDFAILRKDLVLLLLGALVGYGVVFSILRRSANAHVCAAAIVAAGLGVYWKWFDHALHTQDRYFLRTVLLIATPVLGAMAAILELDADGRLSLAIPLRSQVMAALASSVSARVIGGGLLLVTLVHVVETVKFVSAWTNYKAAIVELATGDATDPALGDSHLVSSDRIAADLNRLSWNSTTPFLSVIAAPDFAPKRLVVDPNANYFWLSCKTATANLRANRAVPEESRQLVRVHACLHRQS